ncbi:MAG: alpha-galactosidase [Oscillospiraceae bacterium]|nr:alpha-galactosidase [Oscillospiraceae bacterium]
MIFINKDNVFHLQTAKTSYVFRALPTGQLEGMYYGRRIRNAESFEFIYDKHAAGYSNSTAYTQDDTTLSLDHIALEYSAYGKGDYRLPAMQLLSEDGIFTTDFKFKSASVSKAKPELKGLPSSYGESDTLTVVLEDTALGAELHLYYTAFEKCNVITRSTRLVNKSSRDIKIRSMMSMQLDLQQGDYVMLTFDGTWVRERYKHEHDIVSGVTEIGSISGASSNRHNPFFALRDRECNEHSGDCYGFNLVYSGNHIARAEVSPHGLVRIQNGINPFEFEWTLKKDKYFDTPESVMTFSHEGLNGMSRNMHDFVNEHIVRGYWKGRERPVLVNNWEATTFNFNEKKILDIAAATKEIGAEMFVLDDGWFGKRNNDTAGLGDWYVNKKKLPSGIDGLSKKINDMGLQFGLWVEPEMVNPDSDLYRAHPDWAVTTDVYTPSQGRNQLILDLTKAEVREYIINAMIDVFRSGNIAYIKWDNNRHFSDVFSRRKGARSGEFFHRYIMGLYEIWEALTTKFPEILFEACSSGGNRFDLGTFCYMPQCWTSDNTDPLDRVHIQGGTSYGYPQSVMTMHVACATSFADFRWSNIEHRFNVSAFGVLGYELDVTQLTRFERACVKKQIEFYKQHRRLLQFGDFSRIGDIATQDRCKWQITAKDGSEAIMGYFVDRITPNWGNDVIKFVSLREETLYDMTARLQLLNLKTFSDMINVPLPKKINMEDSVFFDYICDIVKLRSEKENYSIYGDSLMYSGFKPKQPYNLSGYKFSNSRMILDNDSRMYYLKARAEQPAE